MSDGKRETIEGHLSAAGIRFAVLCTRFNYFIVDRLVAGAIDAIKRHGGSDSAITVVRVPGAFELPLAAKWCAESGRFAGVACLGVVIRGETNHYDYVCAEAASGIQRAQLDTGVPCAFGVITCSTMEQAEARAGGDKRDRLGHTLHHQGLPLDEQFIHDEQVKDAERESGGDPTARAERRRDYPPGD